LSEKTRSLLLESLIVIVSILIAFALDASWDRFRAQSDLRQDLAGVGDELAANRDALASQMLLVERVAGSIAALLDAMDRLPNATQIIASDTTIWISQRTPTFDPSFGAIDALVASGRLAGIEDPRLRRNLAGLASRATDAGEELLEAQNMYQIVEAPLLFPGLELRAVSGVGARLPEGWENHSIEGGEQIQFPNSRGLRSAMEQRRALYQIALGELGRLDDHLAEIASVIGRQ